MKYRSCHLIEHGISIDVDSIKACCLSREFNKGQLPIIGKYEKDEINWQELFEIKKRHRKHQQHLDLGFCEGCYNLREEDWDEEDYISFINFDHWSQCNSNCIYCGVQANKPKTKNNVLKPIKELIKQGNFRNNGEITFQGGEPTILKEFEDLLKLFIKQGSKVRIHSSGILCSKAIKDGLKKGVVSVVISPDSANKETYKTVKRVDKSDRVWDTIRKYRKDLTGDNQKLVKVKFIIIPGINDSIEEINEFINKIKTLDIKSIIVDVEYTYANKDIKKISPHVYMLMDYIENFANNNNIDYDLYDSAKYAVQNRAFEKITDFTSPNFDTLFNKYKEENIKQNVKYNL